MRNASIINTINFQSISNLSPDSVHKLKKLCFECNEYEPYYSTHEDSSIMMFVAYKDDKMIGFLSLLISDELKLAEITALISPPFRQMGIYSELLNLSKSKFFSNKEYENYKFVASLSSDYLKNHVDLIKEINYTEYMMKLTSDDYFSSSLYDFTPSSINHNIIDTEESEFCFSDDKSQFLMYKSSFSVEPCAVLNLAKEPSFVNIFGVWVDNDIRGNGIGSFFMQSFLDDYFDCDSNEEFKNLPLILNVRNTNAAAFNLYKKCGFTEVSHIDYYNI